MKTLDLRPSITAARCGACGLVQLMETIDPVIYREYSYIGISSSTYEGYLRDLAADLVGTWGLREKRVFEIGANRRRVPAGFSGTWEGTKSPASSPRANCAGMPGPGASP
ncbi:MAG: hypothetical protein MZW92_31035 [Comamonadaceae bacterium]|nr:hypothetical protein [Comamonadaceae bacterium]